jgi:hypothetical protein
MAVKIEDLKFGNPDLSDAAAEFGMRRGEEVFKRHGTHQFGHLVLDLIQVSALLAGAYNDGLEDGRAAEAWEAELRAKNEAEDAAWSSDNGWQDPPTRAIRGKPRPDIEEEL